MAGRRWWRLGSGAAAALAGALAFLSGHDGGGAGRASAHLPVDPRREDERDEEIPPANEGERVSYIMGRAFRTLGALAQGGPLRERAEGYYAMYRLLRALGMSDQEIAALVARQVRDRVERRLEGRAPTAADTRQALDALQETIIRTAQEVDTRLSLGGGFVRPVREAVLAARAGREDAIITVERTLATAREQFRLLIKEKE